MNILKTITSGLATSMGLKVVCMALRLITITIMPLWMSASEIGFAAIVMVFANISSAFVDLGFGSALVKDTSFSDRAASSVLSIILISGSIISAAFVLGADHIERLFGAPALLIMIAAPVPLLNGLSVVPNAILQRNLKFTNLALRDLVGEIAFSGTTIFLAASGYGAISVAAATVSHRLARLAVSFVSVNWKPVPGFSPDDIGRLTKFSMFQAASLSLTQIYAQADKLILATMLPSSSLGFYSQAHQLTVAPVQSLVGTANNVFFASFAKVQNEPDTLRTLFVRTARALALASGAMVMLAAPATNIIPLLYGPDWSEAVPVAISMCAILPAFCCYILEGIMIAIGGAGRRVISSTVKLITLGALSLAAYIFTPTAIPPAITMVAILGLSTAASVSINLSYIICRLRCADTSCGRATRKISTRTAASATAAALMYAAGIVTSVFIYTSIG